MLRLTSRATLHTQVIVLSDKKDQLNSHPHPHLHHEEDKDNECEKEHTVSPGFMFAFKIVCNGTANVKWTVVNGAPVRFHVYRGENREEVAKREGLFVHREKIENVEQGQIYVLHFQTMGRRSVLCFAIEMEQ